MLVFTCATRIRPGTDWQRREELAFPRPDCARGSALQHHVPHWDREQMPGISSAS